MELLRGKRVAVAASRKAKEIGRLIEKSGGTPLIRPAQGTLFPDERRFEADILFLLDRQVDWLILTTGIGTEALFAFADQFGKKEVLLERMQQMRIAARGYKTVNVLQRYGLIPLVKDREGTVRGLMEALRPHSFAKKTVFVQLYGDRSPALEAWLKERGAAVRIMLPYRHVPPEASVVQTLIAEIANRRVDAVAFTSAIQVRYLFQQARKQLEIHAVLSAFQGEVVPVAVGKVTAEALREEGVSHVVQPEKERTVYMIRELERHFQKKGRSNNEQKE